jgi:ABC-type transport system involved in multi-copper enzyme maturation permease subunit
MIKERIPLLDRERKNAYPTIILFKKTFLKNVCTPSKLIFSLLFMIVIPLLFILIYDTEYIYNTSLVVFSGFTVLMYSFTMVFALTIIFLTGPLISSEIYTGTILSLISKPISRIRIIFGKFAAVLVFGVILINVSLGLLVLISLIKYPFTQVAEFYIIHLLYGLLVLIVIGFISLAFSSSFKKPRTASLIPAILVILIFYVLLSFRPFFTMPFGPENEILYEKFQLYHFDLGYHIINVYSYIVEITLNGIPTDMQYLFYMWGIYKYDPMTYELQRTNYYHPIGSLVLLIVVAIVFLILGIIRFQKRDISI